MKIRSLKPIKHDGTRYEADEVLEVNEEQAKRLIALGVAIVTSDEPSENLQSVDTIDLDDSNDLDGEDVLTDE